MKTLFKRTAAAAAAAVMTLGLAGCGNNTSSTATTSSAAKSSAADGSSTATSSVATSDTSSATSATSSAAATSGETSTPAGNGGTLVIGSIGPITGPAAIYGINVQNGAQLAVDEINAAGGVNGMTLELNFQDDEHDPEKSVNTYNTLKDKGMKLLVGTVTSGPCEAVSKEAAKDNMFLITPSGSSVNAITAGDNCFRMCFNDPQQGKIEADFIAEKLEGKKKVGVIYDSSDSYSTGILEGFKEEAAAKGLEVVAEEGFTSDSNKDFSVQIQKMADTGAEVLFLPIYYTETALILEQADKAGLDIPVLGGDGLDGLIDVLADKVALADGVYALTPYSATATDEKSVKFTEAYKAKFPDADAPIQFAADAYDCVYAIKAALEKAGVNDASIDSKELCDKLKAAMVEIEYDGITGNSKWTTDGEVTKDPKIMQIKVTDGKGALTDIG